MPSGGDVKNYNMEKAFESLKELMENRQKYSSSLKEIALKMRKRSEDNVKYLIKLLEK